MQLVLEGVTNHARGAASAARAFFLYLDCALGQSEWLEAMIGRYGGTCANAGFDRLAGIFANDSAAVFCALQIQEASRFRHIRIAVTAGDRPDGPLDMDHPVIEAAAALLDRAPTGGIILSTWLLGRLGPILGVDAVQAESDGTVRMSVIAPRPRRRLKALRMPVSQPRSARIRLGIAPLAGDGDCQDARDFLADMVTHALQGLSTWFEVCRTPAVPSSPGRYLPRSSNDVAYCLQGVMTQRHDVMSLTLQLTDTATGQVLWGETFDRSADQFCTDWQAVVRQIIRAGIPCLVRRETGDRVRQATDAQPGSVALRAWDRIIRPEPKRFSAVVADLQAAVERHPGHAGLHFALVSWHLMAIKQGWSISPAWNLASAASASAQLGRSDPAVLALLGYLQWVLHRDAAAAGNMVGLAMEMGPSCGTAWTLATKTLSLMGRRERTLTVASRALAMPALGPDRAWRNQAMATACYVAEQYEEAVRWARLALAQHADLAGAALMQAASLAATDRPDLASKAAQRLLAIDQRFRVSAWRPRAHFADEIVDRIATGLAAAGLPA